MSEFYIDMVTGAVSATSPARDGSKVAEVRIPDGVPFSLAAAVQSCLHAWVQAARSLPDGSVPDMVVKVTVGSAG